MRKPALTARDICTAYAVSRSSIHRWMRKFSFPVPFQIGPNSVRWDAAEVSLWFANRPRTRQ